MTKTTIKRPKIDTNELYEHIVDTMLENMDYESATMDEKYDVNDTYSLHIDILAKLKCKFARDDDYFNGTGCYYTTYAETHVKWLEIELYNKKTEDYEDLDEVIDFDFLEREIEDRLTEAAYE